MKKKSHKIISGHDSGRETRVLLEQMNKSIDTIAEQHGSIKHEIGQLKESVDQRFNRVETVIVDITSGVKKINHKLEEHDQRFDRVEAVLMDITSGVKKIDQKVDTVTTDHENRIHKIESVTR